MAEDGGQVVVSVVPGEDQPKDRFKKSQDVAFYRRQMQGPDIKHRALLDTLVLTEKGARVELQECDTQTKLLLLISSFKNDTVRISIDELQPIRARYRVQDVITAEPQCEQLRVEKQTKDSVTFTWSSGRHKISVWRFPFRLEILCEGEQLLTFNSKEKLWFEALQHPPSDSYPGSEDSPWRETFKTFVDIKANGPSSVGADVRLHGFSHLYGLPEHADSLQLKDTRDGEPYRLYNLDVFAYDLHSRLGLYGSVPLLVAHKPHRTLGVFWLNASETFVNINSSDSQDDQTPPVKRRRTQPLTDVHFLSESGVIDCMVLLGPSPQQVFRQYAQLTGFQALPPLFALGYHQCRWNYDSEADVKSVDAGFDLHHIPYDVIWLDIEHTDGKRYFTWDHVHFPDPAGLQRHLCLFVCSWWLLMILTSKLILIGRCFRCFLWSDAGGALLVSPVTDPGVQEVQLLLPGSVCVKVPMFQRGGSVVCRSTGSGSCTAEQQQLPLSLTVALNSPLQGAADGELYLDDGHSFSYRDRKSFCLRRFSLLSGRLLCRSATDDGSYHCDTTVRSVTILGVKRRPSAVTVLMSDGKETPVDFEFKQTSCQLTLNSLDLRVTVDWEIQITG